MSITWLLRVTAFSALLLSSSSTTATALHSTRATELSVPAIRLVTAADWNAFNTSVGGRLRVGYPVARPCFKRATNGTGGAYDAAQCRAVQKGYKNDLFIADNFGAYMNVNWGACQSTGDQCELDYTTPTNLLAYTPPATCSQGSVSPYYVDVREVSDVQTSFAFAKKHSLPIAIKNSGHDYKGRSSAPDSLGLWTHNIQYIKQKKAFVPAGCTGGQAVNGVTFGAGNGFLSLFQFAEANNITILGGSSETVGASGGWGQAGGHGALSNLLGLGVDRAVEMKIVLTNGTFVTASRCQNADLFFAIRGGGGGTFGLVMETTTTAAPQMTLQVVYVKFLSLKPASASKFLSIIIDNMEKWTNESWGGYIEPGAVSSSGSGLVLATPSLTTAQAKLSMKPLTDFASSLGTIAINNKVAQADSFLQFYNTYLVPNEEVVGLGVAVASRLIPDANFATADKRAELLNAMTNVVKQSPSNLFSSPGLAYGGAPIQILVTTPYNYKPDGTSSVTPAWYKAYWHVLIAPTFNYGADPTEIKRLFDVASSSAQLLRDITPGSGAYQNEADVYEPDHEESFWGTANYNKLVMIKKQYDPDNLLCIGWNQADSRYKCYPNGG